MTNLTFRPLKEWANRPIPGNDTVNLAALRVHFARQFARVLGGQLKSFEWTGGYFDKFSRPEHFAAFYRIVLVLSRHPQFTSMFGSNQIQQHWVNITLQFHRRIREPETWTIRNGHDAVLTFTAHLFEQYVVPPFIRNWVYRQDAVPFTEWYFHLTRGGSAFELKGAPLPVTRGMAHELMNAPGDQYYPNVFRWAQLRAMCMREDLIHWIGKSPLMTHFEHNEFWEAVFRLLVRDFNLEQYDEEDLSVIMVYLGYTKLGMVAEVYDSEWTVRYVQAPHPNFTLEGRNVASLLRQARRWYAGNRAVFGQWNPVGYPELVVKDDPGLGEGEYHLIELLTSYELSTEGQMMSHCVADYVENSRDGHCSIWSLRKVVDERPRRMVTIEVNTAERELVQVCGPCNEPPTEVDLTLIRRWAAIANLGLGEWAPVSEAVPAAPAAIELMGVPAEVVAAADALVRVAQPGPPVVDVWRRNVEEEARRAQAAFPQRPDQHDDRRLGLAGAIAIKVAAALLIKLIGALIAG